MPSVLELKEQRGKKVAELSAIAAAAKAADDGQGRPFTDPERERIKTLQAEDAALQAQVTAAERREQEDRDLHASIGSLSAQQGQATGRVSQPDPVGIVHVKDNTLDDPNRGFKSPREFLTAVIVAGSRGHIDKRLHTLSVPGTGAHQLAAGSDEGRGISDPAGGFLIPTGFHPTLLMIDPEADPIGAATMKVPMELPVINIPARVDKNHSSSVSGGLTVSRRPETVAGTSSTMSFERVQLTASNLFGLSYATEEILMDSPIAFAALLERGFRDQFTYQLIQERLYGTGAGEFLGVLNALDASSLGPTLSISKETGQAAATLVYENVLKMRARCWGYAKAFWLANHDTIPQLMLMNQSVGTGGLPVWQPSAREDHPDVLLGRPLYFSEYCKTLGTTGDLILGNWTEYLEGTYQPMQSAESIHVRFVNHERTFKFWMRNAGAPWWKSALTPNQGSNKLSPFVILATRS